MKHFSFAPVDSPEGQLRQKISSTFDEFVQETMENPESKDLINNPLFGGMLKKSAIVDLYQNLKGDEKYALIAAMYAKDGIDYYAIVDDECRKALVRHNVE